MNYETILNEAHTAAAEAVKEATERFDEMKGACGFAWVIIEGNSGLARYCRKQLKTAPSILITPHKSDRYGDKGYPRGWQFWNPGNHHGQRIDIKEAGARAFMHALARHGIRADVGSRLD